MFTIKAKVATEPKMQETEGDMIIGTFPVCIIPAYVLLDIGVSHSFISHACVKKLVILPQVECLDMVISTPNQSLVHC